MPDLTAAQTAAGTLWRPFAGVAFTVTLCAGVFIPAATVEKMNILALLLGGNIIARSVDKRVKSQPKVTEQ